MGNKGFDPVLFDSEPQRVDHQKVLLVDLPKRIGHHVKRTLCVA